MGRFHCITDGCAEVWYREFLPERLEYQYLSEEIQTIEGKNLTWQNNPLPGSCPIRYEFLFEWEADTNSGDPPQQAWVKMHHSYRGPVSIENVHFSSGINVNFDRDGFPEVFGTGRGGRWILEGTAYDTAGNQIAYGEQAPGQSGIYTPCRGKYLDIRPLFSSPDGCLCKFDVFSDGNLIFSRTESSCPTVNYFPPQPSDEWKTIKIAKQPIWEKVQVVDNNSWNELVSELKEFINGDIPDECIEIWKTPVLDLDILPGNTRTEKYEFIGQYCSPAGCPPPEYQVICRDSCQAEKCPPDTCEVECADHLCCYNSQGIAILNIDK